MPPQGEARKHLYLVADAGMLQTNGDEFDFRPLIRLVWSNRWLVMAIAAVFGLLGASYAFLAPPWYRAETVLAPSERASPSGVAAQLSQLGGLASIAGLSIAAPNKEVPLATLQSRAFAEGFIEEQRLLTALFAEEWDSEMQAWRVAPDQVPDIRDAVRYFLKKVLRVTEDKRTGLVTITVDWTDPDEAARWANLLSSRINEQTREIALAEAKRNLEFLRDELSKTQLVSMQQSIGRLMESELQKYMLARGAVDYSFRVIDPATVPKKRHRPKRALTVALSLMLGVVVGSFLVLWQHRRRPNC